MWFKNLKLFRLASSFSLSHEQLCDALERMEFKPNPALSMQTMGWIAPREDGPLAYTVNGQYLLTLRVEKKLLPSTVVTQVTKARAADIEEQQGYKPGRKQMKEIKERVADELLPKAFSVYRDTRVWIDPVNRWVAIDAAASGKADEVLGMLAKTLDPFPIESLYVVHSPASAMTSWLAADEAPANFTIDQDTELRASGESRAAVRYVKHTIDTDDVRRHIQSGKQCTRLALTWADRVSLVLTDGLDIKGITPLDVLKENADALATNDDEKFDSDMMLMTGELAKLIDDLLSALGGEKRIESAEEFKLAPLLVDNADDDPVFLPAVELVVVQQRASISLIQRHFNIGYNRAARILEWMEKRLIVSPIDSGGSRTVLTQDVP